MKLDNQLGEFIISAEMIVGFLLIGITNNYACDLNGAHILLVSAGQLICVCSLIFSTNK
jgi:hypothetical protein